MRAVEERVFLIADRCLTAATTPTRARAARAGDAEAANTGHARVWYLGAVKTTRYFDALRTRPDRAVIQDEWIERTIRIPFKEKVQADGRIRRWAQIPEAENRFLRVVLLADGETVHNAFFDRRFAP